MLGNWGKGSTNGLTEQEQELWREGYVGVGGWHRSCRSWSLDQKCDIIWEPLRSGNTQIGSQAI